jgi:hypothetical protein
MPTLAPALGRSRVGVRKPSGEETAGGPRACEGYGDFGGAPGRDGLGEAFAAWLASRRNGETSRPSGIMRRVRRTQALVGVHRID